eukprot:scaffold273393_cov16-Tisochrysis_lutea.AAC.1
MPAAALVSSTLAANTATPCRTTLCTTAAPITTAIATASTTATAAAPASVTTSALNTMRSAACVMEYGASPTLLPPALPTIHMNRSGESCLIRANSAEILEGHTDLLLLFLFELLVRLLPLLFCSGTSREQHRRVCCLGLAALHILPKRERRVAGCGWKPQFLLHGITAAI